MKWALLLLTIVMCGCEKDTHYDSYYIDYKKGQEYTQTFYVAEIDYKFESLTIKSIDNRINIRTSLNSPIAPKDLSKPNLEETFDLKLYHVADFKFIEGQEGAIEETHTKIRDWHWVFGRIEYYTVPIPGGYTFQKIVIVREI